MNGYVQPGNTAFPPPEVTTQSLFGRRKEIMKKTFLIDTENVGLRWIPLIKDMNKGDKVLIFYTDKSPNPTFALLHQILTSKIKVECIQCLNGSANALDFQLVTELGRRIRNNRRNPHQYIIVSGDKGFDAVVEYWSIRSYDVSRETCVMDKNLPIRQNYEQRLKNVPIEDEYIKVLLPILVGAMKLDQKNRKQTVYMGICKKYGVTDGATLYRRIQPLVKEIASTGPFPT